MRTNIDLDEELLTEAFRYSEAKTKKDLVNIALKEFITMHKRKDLAELRGKITFFDDYSYKEMREGK